MSVPILQVPSLVLPVVAPLGTELETIGDALVHRSIEIPITYLQEKTFHVLATEIVGWGIPDDLTFWVELSPYPSTVSDDFWSAIGGGGGDLVPATPATIHGTGVHGTQHTELANFTMYGSYARICCQTLFPVATAVWMLQIRFEGKGN